MNKLFVVVPEHQDPGYEAAVFAPDASAALADFRSGSPSWGDVPDDWYDSDVEVPVSEFDGYVVFGPYIQEME